MMRLERDLRLEDIGKGFGGTTMRGTLLSLQKTTSRVVIRMQYTMSNGGMLAKMKLKLSYHHSIACENSILEGASALSVLSHGNQTSTSL